MGIHCSGMGDALLLHHNHQKHNRLEGGFMVSAEAPCRISGPLLLQPLKTAMAICSTLQKALMMRERGCLLSALRLLPYLTCWTSSGYVIAVRNWLLLSGHLQLPEISTLLVWAGPSWFPVAAAFTSPAVLDATVGDPRDPSFFPPMSGSDAYSSGKTDPFLLSWFLCLPRCS